MQLHDIEIEKLLLFENVFERLIQEDPDEKSARRMLKGM